MKIKVDKDEYESLLKRVDALEESNKFQSLHISDLIESQYKRMDAYFAEKTKVVLIKRDKEKIIGELRTQAMDNIFREKADEEATSN